MLTYRQIEDAGEAAVEIMAQAEQEIITDMARRISRLGEVTETTNWQALRLELMGTARTMVLTELSRAMNVAEQRVVDIFDEAATRALAFDNRLYRAADYNPVPLAENYQMQQLIQAGVNKTLGTFQNLTLTTANTAVQQFERALDLAYQKIVSGAFTYQQAIKAGISELARNGIGTIVYPSGHMDRLDVAFRRAVLTGVNQTAAEIQLENISQLGTDLVETTAHHGARPDHQVWQGRVFSISGTHKHYPNFRLETGYGEGHGLAGWNCRHSFFPFFEGLSDRAYPDDLLRDINNKKVMFNGEELDLFDATQHQRYIERQIRKWKREASALEAAGLDNSVASQKVRDWQARQRDFISQTGLRRDYFRERGGKQFTNGSKGDIINVGGGLLDNANISQSQKDAYRLAVMNEPAITRAMTEVAKSSGAHIDGLDYRLKAEKSYIEKIVERGKSNPDDIVRYTFTAPPENQTEMVQATMKELSSQGFETTVVKNYWQVDNNINPYNGVNTYVRAPNGQVFELQFHTPEGFKLKNGALHDLYEQQRLLRDKTSAEALRLQNEMANLSNALTIPDRIEEVAWR